MDEGVTGRSGGHRPGGLVVRLGGELMIIVVGVLIALAADRWNQDRADQRLAADYLSRLTLEIRQDSIAVEEILAEIPQRQAWLDRLISAIATDPDFERHDPALILEVSGWFVLPPIVAWTELNNSGLLSLHDDATRRALSE